MSIAKQFLDGLKEAYSECGGEEIWEDLEQRMHGVSQEDLEKLLELYPDTPESLLELLKTVDGTYWREYEGKKVTVYLLGADFEYPYYLLSAKQMQEGTDKMDWLADIVDRAYDEDEVEVDERITDKAEEMCWLHFADCMNNGGSSRLFIDFSPSPKGVKGQIVRYLHDPDEVVVIADSFDEYLQMLIDNEYDFLTEDLFED